MCYHGIDGHDMFKSGLGIVRDDELLSMRRSGDCSIDGCAL